jgi:hypothetical protein
MNVFHASFEAFTAVTFQVEVFWVVTPCDAVWCCGRIHEDGGGMDL